MLEYVRNHWKSRSLIANISYSEALHVLLSIDFIKHRSILDCIECMQSGFITGRMALYCISEITSVINKINMLSSSFGSNNDSGESMQDVHKIMDNIQEIGEACISPLFTFESSSSYTQQNYNNNININNSNEKSSTTIQSFTNCLELLPAVVATIHSLKRFCTKSYLKQQIDLLDSIFFVQWNFSLLLPISSILCEMYSYLTKKHLYEFKKRLLSSTSMLQTHSEDYAGVIRVILRLFEQSQDSSWSHVIRVLYCAVPSHALIQVEVLLEQILSQSLYVAQLLLCAIEDTAVQVGKLVVTRSYENVSIHEYYTEYDGIPSVKCSDLSLALLIIRSMSLSKSNTTTNNNGNVNSNESDEIALPFIATISRDTLAQHCEAQLSSRTLFMLLLSCTIVQLIEPNRNHSNTVVYEVDGSANHIHKPFIELIMDNLNRIITTDKTVTISHSSVSTWIHSSRVQELVTAFFTLGTYSQLFQSCKDEMNSWMIQSPHFVTNQLACNQHHSSISDLYKEFDELKYEIVLNEFILRMFKLLDCTKSAILCSVLRGILHCAELLDPAAVSSNNPLDLFSNSSSNTLVNNTSSSSNSNNRSSKVLSTTTSAMNDVNNNNKPKQLPDSYQNYLNLLDLLQIVLKQLCMRFSQDIATRSSIIQLYFNNLSILKYTIAQYALHSFIPVAIYSDTIYSLLLSLGRKYIQNSIATQKILAIHLLIPLFFAVNDQQQLEISHTLSYMFQLSIVYCKEIYSLCLYYLQKVDGNTICNSDNYYSDNSNENEDNLFELFNFNNAKDYNDIDDDKSNDNLVNNDIIPFIVCTKKTLLILKELINKRLKNLFTYKQHNYHHHNHHQQEEEYCFDPLLCIQKIELSSTTPPPPLSSKQPQQQQGIKQCTYNEDIYQLLQLAWCIDMKLDRKATILAMTDLCIEASLPEEKQQYTSSTISDCYSNLLGDTNMNVYAG